MPHTRPIPLPPPALTERHQRYWAGNLRLTSGLMGAWLLVTFGVGWFARDLNFSFFGWPFSFWVASQGAPVVYLLIVVCYAHRMDAQDRVHGVAEPEDD
ncbi:MAG: hypothetical protein RJA98_704 [Pseudomonadota bacterium]